MASDVLARIDELSSSVSSLQSLFDCPICLDMLKDPVRTSCGHTFCRMCIKRALRKLTKEPCPNCKTLLSFNKRNIFQDDTMSVFMGLVFELISSINAEIGFDITAYHSKPLSSYEASMNSEEFVNMKSNNVIAQKIPDDPDVLMNSRSPLIEPIPGVSEHNIGALNEKVKKSKTVITGLMGSKSRGGARVENTSKKEDKIPVSRENATEKLSIKEKGFSSLGNSSSKQVNVLMSKENLKNSKEVVNNTDENSLEPQNSDEFNFVKPKSSKNIFKRKHTSSSDDLITALNDMNKVEEKVEKVEENRKKKIRTSVEDGKNKGEMELLVFRDKGNKFERIIKNVEFEGPEMKNDGRKRETSVGMDKNEKRNEKKKIVGEDNEEETENDEKKMKKLTEEKIETKNRALKINSQRKIDTKKSILGPSHSLQRSLNKIGTTSCSSNDKRRSIRANTPGIKKSSSKKTEQSTLKRPLKSVARRSANFAASSTFVPKKLNDKTAKFYFVTSLVMEKFGQKPVSLMKRKYAVATKSNDDLLKSSTTTMKNSIQDSDVPVRKPHPSVSLKKSSIKSREENCQNSAKKQPIEKLANVDDAKVNDRQLNTHIFGLGNGTVIVRESNIVNSTSLRESNIGNSTSVQENNTKNSPNDSVVDVGNNPVSDDTSKQCPMNVSQEEMDIFEEPASLENEDKASENMKMDLDENDDKLDKNADKLDENADKLDEADSDLTQVNPYIKNRDNLCRKKTTPSRFADFVVENRSVSTRKLKNSSQKSNESEEPLNTPKRKNSQSRNSATKSSGKKMNSQKSDGPKNETEKNSTSNDSGVKKLNFAENSNTPENSITKNSNSRFIIIYRGGKKLLITKNKIYDKGSNETPAFEESIKMLSKTKSENHEVANIDNESALNKNKKSLYREQDSHIDCVVPSSHDFRFSQLTGQSVGNTQEKKMNTAFFGSSISEPLVSQQMDFQERSSDINEAPNVIDGSDDEEIPQTPDKAEQSIIMSQLNSSKLDTSLSNRSIIPSSLDISEMGTTSKSVQKSTKRLPRATSSSSNIFQKPTKQLLQASPRSSDNYQKSFPPTEKSPQASPKSSDNYEKSPASTKKSTGKSPQASPRSLDISQRPTSNRGQQLSGSLRKQCITSTEQEGNQPNLPSSRTVEETANDNPVEEPKKYSFVYSRLASNLLEKLREFAAKINATITSNITEETTHVILAPEAENRSIITYKFLKGVAMKLWVVSIDWVQKSLESEEILSEIPFLTFDPSGEPGPRRCKFEDSLPFSNFIIVPMPPYGAINEEQVKDLIVLCGGRLVERLEDLPEFEQNTPRILITDSDIDAPAFESYLENDLIIPLRVDWLIDCVGAYKPTSVVPHLHHPLSNTEILLCLGLTEELVQDDEYDGSDGEE